MSEAAQEAPGVEPFITGTSPLVGVNPAEVLFIQQHQHPVVKAMKPYLRDADRALDAGTPINTVQPVVSGTGTVGQTLSCTTGTWLNTPVFTYQWYASGVLIAGATAATRVLAAGESGKNVTCIVTGTKLTVAVAAPASNSIAVA